MYAVYLATLVLGSWSVPEMNGVSLWERTEATST